MTSTEIDTQQNIANELIQKLEIVDPDCILAGGAPRNWFLGKPAKDLDFYIHTTLPIAKLKVVWDRLGFKLIARMVFNTEALQSYGIIPSLRHVYELEYKGIPVQIMCMCDPTFDCVVDYFGVSICKLWWKSKERGVMVTPEALISVSEQTLFVNDDYSAKEIHVTKMVGYFPNYKIRPSSECREKLTGYRYYDLQSALLKLREDGECKYIGTITNSPL
jgi:hypothetical protein